MTVASRLRAMRNRLFPLDWQLHPPEVLGEKVYTAVRGDHTFWVKKEPQDKKWTCVVTDAQADPIDLAVDVAGELSKAKKWCEEWRG